MGKASPSPLPPVIHPNVLVARRTYELTRPRGERSLLRGTIDAIASAVILALVLIAFAMIATGG